MNLFNGQAFLSGIKKTQWSLWTRKIVTENEKKLNNEVSSHLTFKTFCNQLQTFIIARDHTRYLALTLEACKCRSKTSYHLII